MMRAVWAVIVLLLLALPVYLRVLTSSSSFLEAARSAKNENRTEEAIQNYRKAASWRSPFPSSADEALVELRDFVRTLSDPKIKLEGYRELRSALYNSRSFLNYSAEGSHRGGNIQALIKEAESEIDQLATIVGRAPRNIELQPENRENFAFQLLSQAAFWGWMFSVFYFIFSAFDREGKLVERRALFKAIPLLAVYCLWICALIYA